MLFFLENELTLKSPVVGFQAFDVHIIMQQAVLQVRRGNRDNLGAISHISP